MKQAKQNITLAVPSIIQEVAMSGFNPGVRIKSMVNITFLVPFQNGNTPLFAKLYFHDPAHGLEQQSINEVFLLRA